MLGFVANSTYQLNWTIDEINGLLGVSVPQDAINVSYTGQNGIGAYLNLEFEAPAPSVNSFLKAICSGVVFRPYDPFSATDIGEPFTYVHPILIGEYPYYSYSPGTPATIIGNRCGNTGGGWLQFRVDTSNAQLYDIRLEVRFSCDVCRYVPIKGIRPFSGSPIQVLGLKEENNTLTLSSTEACFGIDPDVFHERKAELIGASIQITIDAQPIASAKVDNQAQMGSRLDTYGNSVEVADSGNSAYYCFQIHTSVGAHRMQIQFRKTSGISYSHTWNFEVRDKPLRVH
jgi:hypothetical protein